MTKRVGVSESLPDGTCPDNGSPRLCLLDESNGEGSHHQKSKKKKGYIHYDKDPQRLCLSANEEESPHYKEKEG